MPKSVLDLLYNGELNPVAERPQSEEYKVASLKLGDCRERLYTTYNHEQRELYERMMENYYIVTDLGNTAIFEEGFKLGARIACEVMKDTVLPIDGISVTLKTK